MVKPSDWLLSTVRWSNSMQRLFRACVVQKVRKHLRTDFGKNVHLGYEFDVIRNSVIEKGLADFTTGHGKLSVDEKVLLYCFVNMTSHFFSSYANFRLNRTRLATLFDKTDSTIVFDVGCGPATALLALCDLFPKEQFVYCGIDNAPAMQRKARELFEVGQSEGLIHAKSTARLFPSWTKVDLKKIIIEPCSVLVNFSFFFASRSLKTTGIAVLAEFVQGLIQRPSVEMLCLSYTNSPADIANQKWESFKRQLGRQIDKSQPKTTTVKYYKSGGGTAEEEFIREFLQIKA